MSDIKFSAHQTEAGDFERVVLVHQAPRASSEDMDELDGLARAAGGVVIERLVSTRSHPVAATLLGRGKIQELHEIVAVGFSYTCGKTVISNIVEEV